MNCTGINLKHNSQLALKQQYIIKNTSFYSHGAAGFAFIFPPAHRSIATPGPVPSDSTATPDGGVCVGLAHFGPARVQSWPTSPLFLSAALLPARDTAPNISLPATDAEMFVVFELGLELQRRTSVAPRSPDQQVAVTFTQSTGVSPAPRTRAVRGMSQRRFQVTRRAVL